MRITSALAHIVVALNLATSAYSEITCTDPSYICTQNGSSVVGGIVLEPYCQVSVGNQQCVDSAPLNECRVVEASLNCTQTSEECIEYANGECLQTRFTYSCFNENEDMSPAILTGTEFGEIQEEIVSTCDDLDSSQECELINTVDVEDEEVRNINRKEFFRSWWKRERTYSCIAPGEGDNDCGPLESDPSCQLQGDTCLVEQNGVCSNRQFHYICGAGTGDLGTACEPINVCVGDTCLDVEQETSDDFGNSAAWLNILAEMQEDFRSQNSTDPNDIEFFTGTHMNCSKVVGRNCCSISGVLEGIIPCSDSARVLADHRQAGSVHYVGSTCSESVFGSCIKRRYHYCTYNSKFGRVFIEEYKDQVDQGWGSARAQTCGGVTVEDFGNVDVDEMDFTPVFGDIMDDVNLPVTEEIQDFFDDRWPSVETDAEDVYEGNN